MSEDKQIVENLRRVMESAGFILQNADEPGIYVRGAESIQRDAIDWQSEPTDLLREVHDHVKRYRTQVGLG